MHQLPELLRRYRQRAGLTQKQLSVRISYHHTVISRTEKPGSGYLPSDAYLDIFCHALNLSTQEIGELKAACSAHKLPPEPGVEPAHKPARTLHKLWIGAALFILTLAGVGFYSVKVHTRYQRVIASFFNYASTPPGGVLYHNDFSSGRRSEWVDLNHGEWGIYLHDNNQTFGVLNQNPKFIPNAYLTISDQWVDYSVSANIYFESGEFEQIYMVLRSAEDPNCSGYRVGGNREGLEIFRFDPESGKCLGKLLAYTPDANIQSNRKYIFRVDVLKDSISFYLNEKLILSAIDGKYSTGGLSLLAYQVKSAYFDDLRVVKLKEPNADNSPDFAFVRINSIFP